MLPKIDNYNIGEHPIVTRLIKGIRKLKPPAAKYSHTWNADDVLNKINSLENNEKLSLKMLSLKLSGLLALVSGQRVQTLTAISVENIKYSKDIIRILYQQD